MAGLELKIDELSLLPLALGLWLLSRFWSYRGSVTNQALYLNSRCRHFREYTSLGFYSLEIASLSLVGCYLKTAISSPGRSCQPLVLALTLHLFPGWPHLRAAALSDHCNR